jgi:membrane-associated phospholipid phosphatase
VVAGNTATTEVARFNYFMAATLGMLALVEMYLAHLEHYADLWIAVGVFPWLFPIAVVAGYCYWAGHSRLLDLLLSVIWSMAFTLLSGPLVEIAARSPFPLVDQSLAGIDGYVVQTAAVLRWLGHFPGSSEVSNAVYVFLSPPLTFAPLLLPILCRRPHASRLYIFSTTLAMILTMALFALWPAAGPWTMEGFRPSSHQAMAEAYLRAVKLTHVHPVSTAQTEGIVSFPSFHTIVAVLSALALWRVPRVRWFGLVVSVLVCISTVTTGWHYLIDVAGGLVVAFAAWALATRLLPNKDQIAETGVL